MVEGLERRAMLGGSLMAFLAGCAGLPKPPPGGGARLEIGDAHVHFFNGADLPVAGFMEHVLAPQYLSDLPQVVRAMIDIATQVLKALAMTARQESDELARGLAPTREVTASEFAARIAARAEAMISERGFVREAERRPLDNLSDSYFELARLIEEERRRLAGERRQRTLETSDAAQRERFVAAATIDRATLERILIEGADISPARARGKAISGFSAAELWALLKWAFKMARPRRVQTRDYLKTMTSARTDTKLVLNLLVDYDRWLGDSPKAGSDQPAQVEFWTRFSRTVAPQLRIETFAGYDPLRHAEDARCGDRTYFETLKAWATAPADAGARIAGFKLYPPMGFNVSENVPLPSGTAQRRAAKVVADRWASNSWPIAQLPKALDGALDEFFAFCAEHDIPMLAHGRDSNAAFPSAGLFASPRYWLRRAKKMNDANPRHRLRACIGHYSRGDFDFDIAMREILALNAAGKARIYFDLAFDEEFLGSGGAARRLLDHIGEICAEHDPRGEYVMFGTDWIMLGQVPKHERYVETLDRALSRSEFWRDKRENLLVGNLSRFLKV